MSADEFLYRVPGFGAAYCAPCCRDGSSINVDPLRVPGKPLGFPLTLKGAPGVKYGTEEALSPPFKKGLTPLPWYNASVGTPCMLLYTMFDLL